MVGAASTAAKPLGRRVAIAVGRPDSFNLRVAGGHQAGRMQETVGQAARHVVLAGVEATSIANRVGAFRRR